MAALLDLVDKAERYHVVGENGQLAVSEEGMNNGLLVLFDKTVRGTPKNEIEEGVKSLVRESVKNDDILRIKNLFLLAFQTRWCRGGKGERFLFYVYLSVLFIAYPTIVLDLLDLIPEFGYWKDLFLFLVYCQENLADDLYAEIANRVYSICAEQHRKDLACLEHNATCSEKERKSLSLYAKFVPSEGSSLDRKLGSVKEICTRLYGDVKEKKRLFRSDISGLREYLKVVETFMCGKRFSQIDFPSVPSICMMRNTLAFLNDKIHAGYSRTGNRRPDDEDRVNARSNLILAATTKSLQGKQLFPHDLVEVAQRGSGSFVGRIILDAQWKSLRNNVVEMIEKRKAVLVANASDGKGALPIDLTKVVVMCDVSGSMAGTPMNVSIAMGILCSEISHPCFRDVVLTFDSRPCFVTLGREDPFHVKVERLAGAPFETSTNFFGAMREIGKVVRANNLSQEDIPTLLVVSDMQFDEATGNQNAFDCCMSYRNHGHSSLEIKRYFRELGMEMHGTPFDPPTIVFWNVRSSVGFPGQSDEEGVVLLGGYSPALLKFVLSGELEEEDIVVDEDTGEITKAKMRTSPAKMLEKILADPGLDPVRTRLNAKPDDIYKSPAFLYPEFHFDSEIPF